MQQIMVHRKRSSSSSAAIIAGNDDLLLQILLRLPPKSLIRFQAVSKLWRSLISDQSFLRDHTINQLQNRRHYQKTQHSFILRLMTNMSKSFICNPTIKRLVPIDCFDDYYLMWSDVMQSCNGILLLEYNDPATGAKCYSVYNPTTMFYRNLSITQSFSGLYLAFHPDKSPHYKVFCFTSSSRINVYDSEACKWNEQNMKSNSQSSIIDFSDGIYVNDRIYFIRSSCSRETSRYFSLVDEDFHSITRSPHHKYYHVVESNGHLLFIAQSDKTCLLVYEFKRHWFMSNGFWLARYLVDYSWNVATFSWGYGFKVEFLGMIRGEKQEDSVLLLHGPGKVIMYRFVDEVYEVVDFRGKGYYESGEFQFKFVYVHQFIESLAPV